MRIKNRSGFTLIELLVVMAIIGILSGLIFTSIAAVTKKAKMAKAKVQIKQLEKAFVAYHDEYGEWPKGLAVYDNVPDPETDYGVTGIEIVSDVASMLRGVPTTVGSVTYNDQGITFYEGNAKDPWGNPYKYMMDFDDDGNVTSQITDNDGSISAPGQSVIVWSRGLDQSDRRTDGGYKDDITSWKLQ